MRHCLPTAAAAIAALLVVGPLLTSCKLGSKSKSDDENFEPSKKKKKKKKKPQDEPGSPSRPQRPRPVSTAWRPLDSAIAERISLQIAKRTMTDVFPGKPYRVDMFNDDGQGRVSGGSYYVNRIHIDLDRDGKWDEKWTLQLEQGKLVTRRRVSPDDDGRHPETLIDRDEGRWVREGGQASAPAGACSLPGRAACDRCLQRHCQAELKACCAHAGCRGALSWLSNCLKQSGGHPASLTNCWDNFQVKGGLAAKPNLRECENRNESQPDCTRCET